MYTFTPTGDEAIFVTVDAHIALVPKIGAGTIRVYVALCKYRNNIRKDAWPSQRTIADILGTKIQKVCAAIRRLKSCYAISITKKRSPNAFWPRNHYHIPIERKSYVTFLAAIDRRLKATDLRVLIALGMWRNNQGYLIHDTSPGSEHDQIQGAADFLGLPRRTVRESVNRLKKLNAIIESPLPLEWDRGEGCTTINYGELEVIASGECETEGGVSKALRVWWFSPPL